MADAVVFHHALGVTEGVTAFADTLRDAGHRVTVPDLYDGLRFDTVPEGVDHARELGFGTVMERGRRAVEDLPADLVYIGFSLGVLSAQSLTQTRPGARGAVLCYSCVPVSEFGSWPAGVPVQVHGMDADEDFVSEGDLDAARELAATVDSAELFLYPGDKHLFADSSTRDYDPSAAALLTRRTLALLERVSA